MDFELFKGSINRSRKYFLTDRHYPTGPLYVLQSLCTFAELTVEYPTNFMVDIVLGH